MHEIGLERTSPQHGHGRSLSWINTEYVKSFLAFFVVKYQQSITLPQWYQLKEAVFDDPIIAVKLT